MNERIEQLYSQVGLDFENFQRVTVTKGDMEKFAELIVAECVGVCNKQTPNWKGEYATAFDDGIEFCISGIKEHFGVEE